MNRTEKSPEKSLDEVALPILVYYRIRGLAQPVRNLLYHLNIQFIDQRLEKNSPQIKKLETLESTFDSGLPQFQDNGLKVSDCVAIAFHICMKHGASNLIGSDLISRAKINEVLFKFWVEKNKIMPALFQIVFAIAGIPEIEKVGRIKQRLTKLVKSSKFLTFCIDKHDLNQGWVLKQLSLVDFYFYETCYYVKGFFEPYIKKDQMLMNFVKFCNRFEQLPFHKQYCKQIQEVKILFPFVDESKNEIVISAWNHEENII